MESKSVRITELDKQEKARRVASESDAIISTQVLKEFINTLRRKFKLDWINISESG